MQEEIECLYEFVPEVEEHFEIVDKIGEGRHQQNLLTYEPRHEKKVFMPYANNKGADQPAHPHSVISTFVVCCLDSVIPQVFISKISSL